jgi:hypothetical protein
VRRKNDENDDRYAKSLLVYFDVNGHDTIDGAGPRIKVSFNGGGAPSQIAGRWKRRTTAGASQQRGGAIRTGPATPRFQIRRRESFFGRRAQRSAQSESGTDEKNARPFNGIS